MLPRVRYVSKTVGKKPKIMAQTGLRSSQRYGSAMKGDLPDTIWDVMQTNHRNGASGIDKSRHVIYSWSKTLQLSS